MSLIDQGIEHLQAGESLRLDIQRDSTEQATVVIKPRRNQAGSDEPDDNSTEARLVLALDQPIRLSMRVGDDAASLLAQIDDALRQVVADRAKTRDALSAYRESQHEAQKHAQLGRTSGSQAANAGSGGDGGSDGGGEAASAESEAASSEAPTTPDHDPSSLL